MDDEARHLIFIAVDATLWMHEWVSPANHFNEGPQPWRAVFVMPVEAVDDGAALYVHRVDGDLIGMFSNIAYPLDTVVQRVCLAHERWLEHQVGFDSQVVLFQIGHGAVP